METYEDFSDSDQILNFLKVFRPIECEWCSYILAFQHKETDKFYCARQTDEDVRKHASCYLRAPRPNAPVPLQKSPGGINFSTRNSAENGENSIREKNDNYSPKLPVESFEAAGIPFESEQTPSFVESRRVSSMKSSATGAGRVKIELSSTDAMDDGPSILSESPNRKPDLPTQPREDSKSVPAAETKTTKAISSSSSRISEDESTAVTNTVKRHVWSNCAYSVNIAPSFTVKVNFKWDVSTIQIAAEKDEDSVENLQKLIGDYALQAKPLNAIPEVGDMVIAKYDDDFYRGKVTKVKRMECKVEFVDFGDAIVCEYSELFPVDDEIMKHPIFGMDVHLKGLPMDPKDVKPTQSFDDILYSSARVEFCQNRPDYPTEDLVEVNLYDSEGAPINEKLKNALSLVTAPMVETPSIVPSNIPPATYMWFHCSYSPNLGQGAKVFCQHQYSITTYHIVAEADDQELTKFQNVLTQYVETAKPLTRPPVRDQIVIGACTKHDGGYYRGRVRKVDGENVTVLFVDYGDRAVCKVAELFPVDDSIMKFPIYGLRIRLDKVKEPTATFQMDKEIDQMGDLLSQWLTLDLVKVKKTPKIPEDLLKARLWEGENLLNEIFSDAITAFVPNNS